MKLLVTVVSLFLFFSPIVASAIGPADSTPHNICTTLLNFKQAMFPFAYSPEFYNFMRYKLVGADRPADFPSRVDHFMPEADELSLDILSSKSHEAAVETVNQTLNHVDKEVALSSLFGEYADEILVITLFRLIDFQADIEKGNFKGLTNDLSDATEHLIRIKSQIYRELRLRFRKSEILALRFNQYADYRMPEFAVNASPSIKHARHKIGEILKIDLLINFGYLVP